MKTFNSHAILGSSSRQGSILVCVLVCLAIATSLVITTVQMSLHARRAMRTQHQLRQTEFLLTAGIDRATLQLQNSSDYRGERWQLNPQILPNVETAYVNIDVSPEADKPRQVQVTASLSTSGTRKIQRSYHFTFDL